MAEKPFRFGVQLGRAIDRTVFADQVRRAEHGGFDTIMVPDHPTGAMMWIPALASAATLAPSLRICPFVLDNDFRNPALTALEAATLDLLSDGRLDLGLGAGWNLPDYQIIGLPFDPPGVRVARLAEAITVIRGAFGGESLSFTGDYYTIDGLGGPDGVLARPCPPILLGGGGQRMLTLAGQRADIVSITPIARRDGSGLETSDATAAAMDRKLAWLRAGAGNRFDTLTINVLLQHLTVTDRPAAAQDALARLSDDWEMAPADLADSPLILIGTVEEIADRIVARRVRWGISYYTIFAPVLDAFMPVINAVQRQTAVA